MLDQVISHPPANAVICTIQETARKMKEGALIGEFVIQRNWVEVKSILRNSMYLDSNNTETNLKLILQIQAAEDLEDLSQQVKKESRVWFWLAVGSAVVGSLLFVSAVILLFQDNTWGALVDLLGAAIPAFLTKVFLDQYKSASERADRKLPELFNSLGMGERPALETDDKPGSGSHGSSGRTESDKQRSTTEADDKEPTGQTDSGDKRGAERTPAVAAESTKRSSPSDPRQKR